MNADDDIKIFDPDGEERRAEKRTEDDLRRLADEMMAQRRNGNSRRACLLGAALSELAPCDGELEELSGKYANDPEILYQIRVLATFTAESGMHTLIANQLLATTAINAFYERLMTRAPEFYNNISDGGAFTFYYLALRKGGDTAARIGETFAMLCDMENNERVKALGTQIYETFSLYVKDQIGKAGFVA